MKRPKGVAAIAIYYLVSAVVLAPLLLLSTHRDLDVLSEALVLFISPVLIVLSVGLWKMKNWARVSAALLTALGLVVSVVSQVLHKSLYEFDTWTLIWTVAGDLVAFLLNLSIIVYLLSSGVRRAFLTASGA